MNNNSIIITKINGKTYKKKIENYELNNYKVNENIMDLLEIDEKIIDKKIVVGINYFIKRNLNKYSILDKYDNILDILEKNDEMINICNTLIEMNNNNKYICLNNNDELKIIIKKLTITNPDIIAKIIAKEIINLYCDEIIKELTNNQISKAYLLYLRNEDPKDILKSLNINIKIEKYNTLIEKNLMKLITKTYESTFPHLCWENCSNLDNCDKIDDHLKKSISKYDFITDGYHIVKINEEEKNSYTTETFYVAKCKNYEKIKTLNKEIVKRKTRTIE